MAPFIWAISRVFCSRPGLPRLAAVSCASAAALPGDARSPAGLGEGAVAAVDELAAAVGDLAALGAGGVAGARDAALVAAADAALAAAAAGLGRGALAAVERVRYHQ